MKMAQCLAIESLEFLTNKSELIRQVKLEFFLRKIAFFYVLSYTWTEMTQQRFLSGAVFENHRGALISSCLIICSAVVWRLLCHWCLIKISMFSMYSLPCGLRPMEPQAMQTSQAFSFFVFFFFWQRLLVVGELKESFLVSSDSD